MKKARKNSEYRGQRNSRAGNEGAATRKVSLERPLYTIIRPSLLLPPEARLRYSLNKKSKLASEGIWGLKEAMSDATLLLTAWDGISARDVIHSSKGEAESINVSLPFCSNGVSIVLIITSQMNIVIYLETFHNSYKQQYVLHQYASGLWR